MSPNRRTEMQFRTRAKVINTNAGKALTVGFRLGPISVFIIANLPEENGNPDGPLAYIKMDLRPNDDWWNVTEGQQQDPHS